MKKKVICKKYYQYLSGHGLSVCHVIAVSILTMAKTACGRCIPTANRNRETTELQSKPPVGMKVCKTCVKAVG